GQQDRALALDLIVPPKSGRIPIDAFCVEQGRWSRRGNEAVAAFSASDNALASKDLKIAAKAKRSQGDVWANVGKAQEKLAANLSVEGQARMGYGRGSGTGIGPGRGINVGGGTTNESGSIAGRGAQAALSAARNQGDRVQDVG